MKLFLVKERNTIMQLKDNILKIYMEDDAVFADAFNFFVYSGEQVIKPETLHELNTAELTAFFKASNNSKKLSIAEQKYRDILKSAVFRHCHNTVYAVLGVENQSEVHYAMPVKNMIYDALQYGRQVRNIACRNRREKTASDSPEFLSGFYKTDRLTPVVTLVVYFNSSKWDGAKFIHEMIGAKDTRLMKYVQDYRINLISPTEITPETLKLFSSSLGKVLGYIKYSDDKNKLVSYIKHSSDMKLDVTAARVINTITKTKIDIPDNAKEIDMCKAIEDLINDSKAEGRTVGRNEGRAELVNSLLNKYSSSTVADMLDMSVEDVMKAASAVLTHK